MTHLVQVSEGHDLPEGQRGLKPARRGAAVVGVLAVVVIAVAAVAAGDDSVSDEALLVLPVPLGDWQLSAGAVTEPVPDPAAPATDERFISEGTLYGVADGTGYDDLRSIVHYSESPLRGARWKPVVTTVGDSYRRVDDSMTFAHEEFGGGWRVVTSPADLVHAYEMLANDISSDLTLLATFAPLEASQIPVTSFVMTSPDGSTFTVETAPGSPLFDAATFAERVEPVDINGTAGWVVTDESEGASETVVTWSPGSARSVRVRSTAPPDAVVGAARRLKSVSADEWTDSLPGLTDCASWFQQSFCS